jgi:hypothetical protein
MLQTVAIFLFGDLQHAGRLIAASEVASDGGNEASRNVTRKPAPTRCGLVALLAA